MPLARQLWDYLQHNPSTSFHRVEKVQGRPSLRYATADLMRPMCVNCHNTHPDSPKTDWKQGTRGVLEVIFPPILPSHRPIRVCGFCPDGRYGRARAVRPGTGDRQAATQLDGPGSACTPSESETPSASGWRMPCESEGKYRHIINAAADAIISLDEQGLVCEFNAAAEQMFGFTKAELLGKPLTRLCPHICATCTRPDCSAISPPASAICPTGTTSSYQMHSKMAGISEVSFPAGGR